MDWLVKHAWEAWLGLGIVLGVAEMFSLDLIMLMLALGAVVGMVAALAGLPVVVQFVAFGAASLAALLLLRPGMRARLNSGPHLEIGHGKLIGRQGVVTEPISGLAPGRIKLAGEFWTAEPYDETVRIEPGETVEVLEIRGATAVVHPIPQLDS